MKIYHAIEIIGYGKHRGYAIKRVTAYENRFTPSQVAPVDGKRYRTEDAARTAAAVLGLTVERVGDYYGII